VLRGGSSPARPTRRSAVTVVALVVGLAGVGCSDDGGDETGTTTSSSASVTTAATVPPTDPGTVTTTSTAPAEPTRPTAYTAQARDAVNELKAAWDEGDQVRARAIAPGEVVDALFPIPPDGFEVYGCDTGEFETSTCSFRNRATGAYITVTSTRTEPGWQVSSLFVDGG
jgi:hypothetical protein